MTITITSAVSLSAAQKKALTQAVTKKYAGESVETIVDPTCGGGLKITIGSKQFDMTVAHQLSSIEKQLRARS